MYEGTVANAAISLPVGGRKTLLVLTGAVLIAICLVFTFVMVAWHGEVGATIGLSEERIAGAVAHEVDRNIELLDLSLQGVAQKWAMQPVRDLSPVLRERVLFDDSARAPGFGAIMVLDRDGQIVAGSAAGERPGPKLDDRDYFRIHVALTDLGLFVSKPFVDRLSGRWSVALSRRLEDEAGDFDGVVAGTIDLGYLAKLYAGLGVGQDSAVTLFRTDGTVLTREPAVQADAHLWRGGDDTFTRMRSSHAGTFEAASPVDGRHRIISYHRVGNLPLIQAIEVGDEPAYADWWRRAAVVTGLLGVLCICVMALTLALHRELSRRAAAEAKLSRLADTDPLTGLANRRRFDAALEAEWSVAAAAPEPVGVLVVDVDAFKAYNDMYGHQAGDAVLRRIAECLDACARGRNGLACRWGGEEFTLVLRGCDEIAALEAADSLCRAVRNLEIEHSAGVDRIVTISVGVASALPSKDGRPKELLAHADAALYRAKAEGRNRSSARTRPRVAVLPLRSIGERRRSLT